MSLRTLTAITAAAFLLVAAAPAEAQERGTIEFGYFGNFTDFDDDVRMDTGFGGGFRVGAFIIPRLSAEFEYGRKQADRPDGLRSVDVETFSARLLGAPLTLGPASLLLGAGFDHTDVQNDVIESDGFQGLVGLKVDLGSSVALRVEGVTEINEDDIRNQALQVGVSLFRHPKKAKAAAPCPECPQAVTRVDTVREMVPFPRRTPPRIVLRDTLVLQGVNFPFDEATLTPVAQEVLDQVARQLQQERWSDTRWEIAGHTSAMGTAEYNMALSERRAEAVRAYLVSKGVPNRRLVARGYGQTQPLVPEVRREGDAWQNRRVELRRIP